jgi:hypothetical protein
MEKDLGVCMKRQKFEVEFVYPSTYGEIKDNRLLRIIEKGLTGDEWGISVTEKKSYQCPNFKPVKNQEEKDKAVVASYEGLIDAQMKQLGL